MAQAGARGAGRGPRVGLTAGEDCPALRAIRLAEPDRLRALPQHEAAELVELLRALDHGQEVVPGERPATLAKNVAPYGKRISTSLTPPG